jgi:hypothetical protein
MIGASVSREENMGLGLVCAWLSFESSGDGIGTSDAGAVADDDDANGGDDDDDDNDDDDDGGDVDDDDDGGDGGDGDGAVRVLRMGRGCAAGILAVPVRRGTKDGA